MMPRCAGCGIHPVRDARHRCGYCRRRGYVTPGRRPKRYHQRDEAALAAIARAREARRIALGLRCQDCCEVCTSIEDCVRRIAAWLRVNRDREVRHFTTTMVTE